MVVYISSNNPLTTYLLLLPVTQPSSLCVMSSSSLPQSKIGSTSIPSIGAGLMSLAAFYGKPKTQDEVDAVLAHLTKLGVQHIDTSNI